MVKETVNEEFKDSVRTYEPRQQCGDCKAGG